MSADILGQIIVPSKLSNLTFNKDSFSFCIFSIFYFDSKYWSSSMVAQLLTNWFVSYPTDNEGVDALTRPIINAEAMIIIIL